MVNTAIITGGSKGLGFRTAQYIAQHSWHVVIANRDAAQGTKAIQALKRLTGNPHLHALPLDLSDFDSIKQFVQDYKALSLPPLRALINNAGIQYVSPTRYTKQGYEMTFGVNHLGHFLLTHLLLPSMPDQSRIINVASGVHKPELKTGVPVPHYTTAYDLAFPQDEPHLNWRHLGQVRYSTSKLCNVLFTYQLSEKLQKQGKNVQVNAFDPGMMPGTGLADDYPWYLQWVWKNIMPVSTLFSNRSNTPKQSGKVLADWAAHPKYADKNGSYFFVGGEEPSSQESYNKALQDDLWEFSLGEIENQLHQHSQLLK